MRPSTLDFPISLGGQNIDISFQAKLMNGPSLSVGGTLRDDDDLLPGLLEVTKKFQSSRLEGYCRLKCGLIVGVDDFKVV